MTFVTGFIEQLRALLPANSTVEFAQVIRAVEQIFGTRVLSHIAEHAVLKRRHANLLAKLHEEGLNVRADPNDHYVIDFQRRARDHHCEEADYRVIQAENGLNGLVSGWEKCAKCGRERHFHREQKAVFGAYFDSADQEAHVPLHTRESDGALGTIGNIVRTSEGVAISFDLSAEGLEWVQRARLNLKLSSVCDEDAHVVMDDNGTLRLEGCFTVAQLRRVADMIEPQLGLFNGQVPKDSTLSEHLYPDVHPANQPYVDDRPNGEYILDGRFTYDMIVKLAAWIRSKDTPTAAGIDVTTMDGRTVYRPEYEEEPVLRRAEVLTITQLIREAARAYHQQCGEWPDTVELGIAEHEQLRRVVPHGAYIEWPAVTTGGKQVALLIRSVPVSNCLRVLRSDMLPPAQG